MIKIHWKDSVSRIAEVPKGEVPERRIVVGLKRKDVSRSSISEDIQSEEMRS
jgi:hypothetical protein